MDRADLPPGILLGLLGLADARGVASDAWWTGTGTTRADVEAPGALLDDERLTLVIGRVLDALPPGPIGLIVGSRDVLLTWGALGVALRSARDGRELLETAVAFHAGSGSLVECAVDHGHHDGVETVELVLAPRRPAHDLLAFICEESIASLAVLMRTTFGAEARPLLVELPYEAPPWAHVHTQLLGCPVRFGVRRPGDGARVVLPRALESASIPTANPDLFAAALDTLRQLVERSQQHLDIAQSVASVLAEDLGARLSMAEVAARLQVSERTLHRRLQDAGYRFGEVRDRLRLQRARTLLRETDASVAAIAGEVGFSDSRELRRAYQRWTGQAPSHDRSALLESR